MEDSILDNLEKRITRCEKSIIDFGEFAKIMRDTIITYTENNNKNIKVIEDTIIKLNALVASLVSSGTILSRDYEKAVDRVSLQWFYSNPQEVVSRFLMDVSKEINELEKKEAKKNRRKFVRAKKYGKQYKG